MKRLIMYRYNSWTEGCGCCSNSLSVYEVYEDGVLIEDEVWCELFENEEDLREGLKHLEPFDVHSECEWF